MAKSFAGGLWGMLVSVACNAATASSSSREAGARPVRTDLLNPDCSRVAGGAGRQGNSHRGTRRSARQFALLL